MVNYCCVNGCGRNNKIHKHLTFYSVPRAKDRQEQWLRAVGREDLLGKASYKSVRLCSRHFQPSQIRKRYLAPDAVPSLSLPGSLVYDTQDNEPERHNGLICNGCSYPIIGFRYKCITCNDYDLCQKCEMLEIHPDHLMIRINRPMKFTTIDYLVKKWHDIIKSTGEFDVSKNTDGNGYLSSDDEPITKYTKDNDSGLNIPKEVKIRIRNEIARVLKSKIEQEADKDKKEARKKRPAEDIKPSKRSRKVEECGDERDTDDSDDSQEVQELAFADVDDVKMIKSEINTTTTEQEKDVCVEMMNETFM